MRNIQLFDKPIDFRGKKLLFRAYSILGFADGEKVKIEFIDHYPLAVSDKKFELMCQGKGIFKTKK